ACQDQSETDTLPVQEFRHAVSRRGGKLVSCLRSSFTVTGLPVRHAEPFGKLRIDFVKRLLQG
ncbi:MAG TPA: hypothetical protein VJM51_01960, partial [Dehalococcoidia bacterium]|nr:hypothetical protein [Dehalococcoidia bacterium]